MAKPLVRNIQTNVPAVRYFPTLSGQADTILAGIKNGVTVDAYRSRIRDGLNAGSNYTMDAFRVDSAIPCNLTSKYGSIQTLAMPGSFPVVVPVSASYYGYYGRVFQYMLVHGTNVSSLNEAEALSRLYSDIKSTYENFNSLNFLGELRESLRMLRSPASALLKNTGRFLDTLKSTRKEVRSRVHPRRSDTPQSLRRRRSQAVVDAVAGSWLEFAFGWSPLANDVKGIAETIARAQVGSEPRFRVSATSRSQPSSGQLFDPSDVIVHSRDPLNRMRLTYSRKSDASVRYVAHLKAVRSGPSEQLSQLAKLSGFALENFIPTAYQLAPWSFLIDYFVNLGDVLEATFTDTSSVFAYSKTVRQVSVFDFVESFYQFDNHIRTAGGYYLYGVSGESQSRRVLTRTSLTRTAGSVLPLPPLVAKIPGIDSKKWLNMAALLASAKAFRFT